MRPRELLREDPAVIAPPLRMSQPDGWRKARPEETETQRIDRVSRSCWYCGREFPRAGAELDAHEDRH
ncbi:hypothetical protein [Salinifilum ghardaiensis]